MYEYIKITPGIFLGACVFDLLLGDPRWLIHPVVIIGKFINFLENIVRRFPGTRKQAGIVLWLAVVIPVYFITWGVVAIFFRLNQGLGIVVTILLSSLTMAARSLYKESKKVVDSIDRGNLAQARRNLSMIVGRDTDGLEEQAIFKAVTETVAENLSDGILAPMFYLAIGGLPLAMVYKAVNTLDSMIGYKNERYEEIGFFSAKMDDIFNWLPARITGLIIVVSSFLLRYNGKNSFRIMLRDGRNHTSPNSGLPEAAMAGSLGVQLGGKSHYLGQVVDKPAIGDRIKLVERRDMTKAWSIMFTSSLLMALICFVTLRIISL